MANELFLDKRLQEKSMRDKKLTQAELSKHLGALPDASDNLVEYDEEGNPTNIPERELKELEIKPGAPEPKTAAAPNPIDPLADAWEEMPGR